MAEEYTLEEFGLVAPPQGGSAQPTEEEYTLEEFGLVAPPQGGPAQPAEEEYTLEEFGLAPRPQAAPAQLAKAKKNIFPSKHPMVRGPDGTTSNVKMMTVEMDGKHYVLPSMVGGRQLGADAAVAHAKRLGLGKYPVFKTADEALKFSQERHADQPAEEGYTLEEFGLTPPTTGTGAHLETSLIEQIPAWRTAVWIGSGEAIRGPPERMLGGIRTKRLMEASRGAPVVGGEIPGDTWTSGVWQHGLNWIAGAAGLLGARFTFPVMAGVAVAREGAESAAHLAAKAKHASDPVEKNVFGQEGGYSSAAAIQTALKEGNLSAASHARRLYNRSEEGVRMTLESLSLPIAASLHAPPGEKMAAAWDAFYMYPLESLIGPAAIVKGAARSGYVGKTAPVKVKTTVGKPSVLAELGKRDIGATLKRPIKTIKEIRGLPYEEKTYAFPYELPPRKTIFGIKEARPLELAPWAQPLFYRTPEWLKPVVWDVRGSAAQVAMSAERGFHPLESTKHVRADRDAFLDQDRLTAFVMQEIKPVMDAQEGAVPLTRMQAEQMGLNIFESIGYRDKAGRYVYPFDKATKKLRKDIERIPREAVSVIPPTKRDYVELERFGKTLERVGLDRSEIENVMAYTMATASEIANGDTASLLTGVPHELMHVLTGIPGAVREITPTGKLAVEVGAARPGATKYAKEYATVARDGLMGEEAPMTTPQRKKHHKEIEKRVLKYGDGGSKFNSPADLYAHVNNSLTAILRGEGGEGLAHNALKNLADKMKNNPAWVEYISLPKSGNGMIWKPNMPIGPEGVAIADVAGLKQYAAIRALEGENVRTYGFPVTERGRLVYTVPENQYARTLAKIMDAWSGGVAERKSEMVTAIYNDRPILRLMAEKNSPMVVKLLSNAMTDTNSYLHKFQNIWGVQQQELSRLLAIEPVKLMRHANTYVTRSWENLTENRLKIQRDLDNDIFGIPLQKTSQRHRRKLNELESQYRLYEMHVKDATGFTSENVLKFSIDQTQVLLENLNHFEQMRVFLDDNGLLSDKQKPGFIQVPSIEDVPGAAAHAKNPYNWMFGSMSGKWVPRELGSALRVSRDLYASVPPIISYWKLVHTAFNFPGYHVRNELGDLLNVASNSGFSPMSKQWRGARKRSLEDTSAWYDKGVLSDDVVEALQYGVLADKDSATAPIVTGDAPIHERVTALGTEVAERSVSGLDPTPQGLWKKISMINNLMTFGEFAKGTWEKWGVSSVKDPKKKGIKLGTAWKNALKEWREAKARDSGEGAWFVQGEGFIKQLNKELSEGIVVRWTVRQENRRRLFAYKMAKELGLKGRDAAKWALDTMHDYGDRPDWLKSVQTHKALAYVQPPFSTYFYKQSMFQMRQALNNPELFVSWMLLNGMDAYDEQHRSESLVPGKPFPGKKTQGEKDFLSRYQYSSYATYGANQKVLQSGRDIVNAFQDVTGWRTGPIIRALEGYDQRGNLHEMTYTLPLRDIGNLSNMLADFQPNESVDRRFSRVSPFVDLGFVFANPETMRSPATGEMVHPSESAMSEYAYRGLQQMVHTFTPWLSWDRYGPASLITGRTRDALISASRGEMYTVGKAGYPIDPVSALSRTLTPGLGISAISQVNMWQRVHKKYKINERKLKTEHAIFKAKLNPFTNEDKLVLSRTEGMFKTHLYLNGLEMKYALGLMSKAELRKGKNRLAARWKELEKRFEKEDNPLESELGTEESRTVMQALLDTISSVYEGKEGEEATE